MWLFKRTTTSSTDPLQVAVPESVPSHLSREVLLNPELLYLIFQYLSPTELFFTARNVHPFWRLVISDTKSLQDRINFRQTKRTWPPAPLMNPILQTAFPMFFQSYQWVDVFSFSPVKDPQAGSGRQMKGKHLSVETLSCPTAAFRSMPVAINLERPIDTIDIVEERIVDRSIRQRRGVLHIPPSSSDDPRNEEEKGLTMGTLMDLCLGWCAGDPLGRSFIVRWRKDTIERSLTEHKPFVPLGENTRAPTTLWTTVASLLTKPLAPLPVNNTATVWRASSLFDTSLYKCPIGRIDTSLEIVLHSVEGCPDWFSDIPNRELTVPGDWNGISGTFGNLSEAAVYRCSAEQAPRIIHSIRIPRSSMKWRWAPRWHCLHCMDWETKLPKKGFIVHGNRG
jgi:hypothetical protein